MGAKPPSSFTFCTDSLLQRSAQAAATLPTGLEWAQAEVFPSMEIGMPVMALRYGPS